VFKSRKRLTASVSWGEGGEFLYEQYLTEDPVTAVSAGNVQECVEGDCFRGKGKFNLADGRVYERDFKFGRLDGKGKMTWPNGDIYEGEFQDGWLNQINGKGKKTYASGIVEEGIFKDGTFVGTVADVERKELQRIALLEQERIAKARYQRIFNACLLDKSADLDMQAKSIEDAVKATCGAIAEDPSWLESLQYD